MATTVHTGGHPAASTSWWDKKALGVPLWGLVLSGGVVLWAAGGAFHTAVVLVLVAALIYQGLAILYPQKSP